VYKEQQAAEQQQIQMQPIAVPVPPSTGFQAYLIILIV
jgi:hypothetical protein